MYIPDSSGALEREGAAALASHEDIAGVYRTKAASSYPYRGAVAVFAATALASGSYKGRYLE